MKQRRLLIISYLPPPYHGVVQMMELAVHSLVLRETFDVCPFYLFKVKDADKRGGLSLKTIFLNGINVVRYIWQCVKFRPHIVYMSIAQNRFGFLRDSLFVLFSKLLGSKVCLHFHGAEFDKNTALKGIIYKKYVAYVLRKADAIIVLAKKFKYQFYSYVPKDCIKVLYNCLPPIKIQSIDHSIREKKKDSFIVLFIGYISKAKGAFDVVRAASLVLKSYPESVFLLCGQPVDTERNVTYIPDPHYGYSQCRDFINEHKLQEQVRLLGYVDGQEKISLLSNADIFVFPPYSEGCGLSALEAMACGLPIITTRVSALHEMLKENENVLFVHPDNYEDIAEKIIHLIKDPNLREVMGHANQKIIEEKYTPQVYEKKLRDILERI